MNAKNVLDKIVTLLSKSEVKMAEAKLVDGTIVESPSFDVEQPLEVVTEEGKVPAPDGEHELVLTDESGNEILIKVTTEGGIIVGRENVDITEEVEDVVEDAVEELAEETDEVKPLGDDVLAKLSYRIEELEKRIAKFEEALPEMDEEVVDKDAEIEELEDEEKLPRLNGAPVEKMSKVNVGKRNKNSQSTFLSKLYN
jgi:uncharacterized coiled-coil protein SlyX